MSWLTPDRRRRFITEAQAASQLQHPHIAVVYEADEIDGFSVIVMEFLRGEKLSELYRERRLVDSAAAQNCHRSG